MQDSASSLSKRMNSLDVSNSPCRSGSIVPKGPQNRELGVLRNTKEQVSCSTWKTGVASPSFSDARRQRKVSEEALSNGGATDNIRISGRNAPRSKISGTYVVKTTPVPLRISGTYVTNPIPVFSPPTPRAGGTPITHVEPQPTWLSSFRQSFTGKACTRTLPVRTVYQPRSGGSKTVTGSKFKGHSLNRTKGQDKRT